MNLLISLVGSDTKEWDKYLPQASLIFNSQAIHGSVNNISRFNLFFNANRFTPNYLYSKMSEDLGLEASMRQQVAFKNIFEKRQQFREYYNTLENPYSIGQYVCRPLSKDEFQTRDNSKGAQATVQNIYKVLQTFPNSCLLESLMDSGESVQDLKHLRPLEPCEVKHLFGRVLTDRGSFSKSLFKRGNRDEQIFLKLDKLSLFSPRCPGTDSSLYDPGIFDGDDEENVNDREYENNPDPDEVIEVLDVPEVEELLAPDEEPQPPDEEGHLIPPELEGTVSSSNPSHPYHLRPRKVTKYTYLGEKKKKVTFCDSVEVSEFCKFKPTFSALEKPQIYPCVYPRREINVDNYFPSHVPRDPDWSRSEIALLMVRHRPILK